MATTIKVTALTRDRVNAVGARTNQTAEQVVAKALAEYERALFWQEYDEAAVAVAANPNAHDEEQMERTAWDRTTSDGIDFA